MYRRAIPFILLVLALRSAALSADPSTISLTILHTNDMHGHLLPEVDKSLAPDSEKVGGAAYLATMIKQEWSAHRGHVLLIDCGDVAQGTPISNMFMGKPMLEFMNAMPYDAGTVGNHEFDWGPRAFADLVSGSTRPLVCANLLLKKTGEAPPGIRPFIIKQVAGLRVGIAGLVTPDTPHISFRRNMLDFDFTSPSDVMKKLLPQMRAAGAQFIVVASHLGDEADRALASEVEGIDVIVGGHSHRAIMDPIVEKGTVIVQAGKYVRYLGRLDLSIDRASGKVKDFTHHAELLPVLDAKVEPDVAVAAIVKKYEDQVAPAMNQVVGQAEVDLPKTAPAGCADYPIGNLITDALRWKVSSDIAIYNAGGIRSELNRGPIKMADVYTLLPFDNYVVTLMLKGEQVVRLLQQGLNGKHGPVQVSGLSVTMGADGNLSNILVGGKPLQADHVYKVATIDFLAEGNDGYTVLREGTDKTVDELARDVFTAYVRKSTPLQAPTAGRIRRLP